MIALRNQEVAEGRRRVHRRHATHVVRARDRDSACWDEVLDRDRDPIGRIPADRLKHQLKNGLADRQPPLQRHARRVSQHRRFAVGGELESVLVADVVRLSSKDHEPRRIELGHLVRQLVDLAKRFGDVETVEGRFAHDASTEEELRAEADGPIRQFLRVVGPRIPLRGIPEVTHERERRRERSWEKKRLFEGGHVRSDQLSREPTIVPHLGVVQ